MKMIPGILLGLLVILFAVLVINPNHVADCWGSTGLHCACAKDPHYSDDC
jgi:hypothetical protein